MNNDKEDKEENDNAQNSSSSVQTMCLLISLQQKKEECNALCVWQKVVPRPLRAVNLLSELGKHDILSAVAVEDEYLLRLGHVYNHNTVHTSEDRVVDVLAECSKELHAIVVEVDRLARSRGIVVGYVYKVEEASEEGLLTLIDLKDLEVRLDKARKGRAKHWMKMQSSLELFSKTGVRLVSGVNISPRHVRKLAKSACWLCSRINLH
eukprot:713992-Ditylum_brightwellii.AAC.1